MPEKDTLQSVTETSRRLAISVRTMRRLIKAKQVRAVRVGYRVLIPGSEIDRIISSGCGKRAEA
jgi:excisionase family DNA binding protein